MHTPVNVFKRALEQGEQQYGLWLGLCSPLATELCAYTGYHWLVIDGEHAPNTLQTVLAQLQASDASPSHAVVRLPEGNQTLIKQYLDLGAQTLLIPMVESAQQAKDLVRYMRYPPAGVRGVGTGLARAASWNLNPDYVREADEELCLLVQVETEMALHNVSDIAAVEGVDGVFIGPVDLAASMGYLGQPNHPKVVEAVTAAVEKIRALGKPVGILSTQSLMAQYYEKIGVQFIALGIDTLLLAQGAQQLLKTHREAMALTPPNA